MFNRFQEIQTGYRLVPKKSNRFRTGSKKMGLVPDRSIKVVTVRFGSKTGSKPVKNRFIFKNLNTIKAIQTKFANYWEVLHPIAIICHGLDPRFKRDFMKKNDKIEN